MSSASKRRRVDEGGTTEGGGSAPAPAAAAPARGVTSGLTLKPDHAVRPIWVIQDEENEEIRIFLETSSMIFAQAQDFLIDIAEPLSRPKHVNEYRLTPASLYAAASVGLETKDILEFLDRLCKTEVPPGVNEFIRQCTSTYGKVRLAVRGSKYFVESSDYKALHRLLQDEVIRDARVVTDPTENAIQSSQRKVTAISIAGVPSAQEKQAAAAAAAAEGEVSDEALVAATAAAEIQVSAESSDSQKTKEDSAQAIPDDLRDFYELVDDDDDDDESVDVVSFEVKATHLENVQSRCIEIKYPLLAEYDFRNDHECKDIESLSLRPTTTLRPYQEKSLRKLFGRGRARSGMIVLPCGAGKTLTGIAAACTIRKRTLVLCKREVAVKQWVSQFEMWSSVRPGVVTQFCSRTKETPCANGVMVCTYSMIGAACRKGGSSSASTRAIMNFIQSRKWGLMILDEVQTAPAATFRQILSMCPCHCKLGLTATLLREDGKIKDLRFLLGPKLYEANWMNLQRDGHIATVKCSEVRVPMTKAFFREYISDHTEKGIPRRLLASLRQLLSVMNPNKFMALEYLIRMHERRGDKIVVFCDRVMGLETFSRKLQKPMVYGQTPGADMLSIVRTFKEQAKCQTLFCSTVADDSIDLPGANVLIQIDSHGGSERQEAQRLGRILRAKKNSIPGEVNAFFYTIVSEDTKEMARSQKRQRFLVNQGYSYKVIRQQDLTGFDQDAARKPYSYSTPSEQQNLLAAVIACKLDLDDEMDTKQSDAVEESIAPDGPDADPFVSMKRIAAADLSGGVGIVYEEKQISAMQMGKGKGKRRNF